MTSKVALLCALSTVVLLLYLSGFHSYLTLGGLQAAHADLLGLYDGRPALVVALFMCLQITASALALPGAVITMSLAAGALFGPGLGILVVLAGLTIGDSLGFLIARFLLRDWVRGRFGDQLINIDRGVGRDGALYLLSLRLMAVVPFFVVNIGMALTPMRLRTFAPASLIGLAPATALYVSAGTMLAELGTPWGVLSPSMIAIFVALGILPLAARFAWRRVDRRSLTRSASLVSPAASRGEV